MLAPLWNPANYNTKSIICSLNAAIYLVQNQQYRLLQYNVLETPCPDVHFAVPKKNHTYYVV